MALASSLAPLHLASFTFLAPIALAAQTVQPAPSQTAPPPAADPKASELTSHRLELRGMQDSLDASQEQRRRIESEIASIRTDRGKLTAALVDMTRSVSATEAKIGEAEARLETLTGSEEAIKRSLLSRRGVIAEILAALQRMGRKPPPALLAAPEDMLQAIRTSMLLGAVLPEMRAETEALAADLSDLLHLRQSIAAERDALSSDVRKLRLDRQHLAALVDARQSALSAAEQALGAERERAAQLAKQTASLKDLIARMESEVAAAARGAEAARRSDEAHKAIAMAPPDVRRKAALAPFKDPARLAPANAFAETKGLLPLPVAGALQRGFGAPDGFGGAEKGMLIATRAEAIVASPCDGWVAFAGPYRTYGQLLIINAGQGYYIILAGMDRINVNVGQFILAGEPVALMGDGSAKTAAAIAIGAAQPILYIEFRKDGAAIDPGPWWVKPELQKVRG
ncbi:murein hydrolase activator EnvC family protein [Methylocapsa aurea]|uniref:murein hydrolase activator EnvC family protein n=1 Tax=Methylocapsa aurea TaxID=663610 RepID=UPI00068B9BD0|nr:peptidoglycan DD-metalloendopeptidase family protein [Methylocapsa aurea]